jgi:hypothetical protein
MIRAGDVDNAFLPFGALSFAQSWLVVKGFRAATSVGLLFAQTKPG